MSYQELFRQENDGPHDLIYEGEFRLLIFHFRFGYEDQYDIAKMMNGLKETVPLTNDKGQIITHVYDENNIKRFVDSSSKEDALRKLLPYPHQPALRYSAVLWLRVKDISKIYYASPDGKKLFHSNIKVPEFQNLCRRIATDYNQNVNVPQLDWYTSTVLAATSTHFP